VLNLSGRDERLLSPDGTRAFDITRGLAPTPPRTTTGLITEAQFVSAIGPVVDELRRLRSDVQDGAFGEKNVHIYGQDNLQEAGLTARLMLRS
jgi:hypothetical protein